MKKEKRQIWVVVIVALLIAIGIALAFYRQDQSNKGPLLKPEAAEETVEEDKMEQHAPTIDIGDTEEFIQESPLSAPKEDEWAYYY
jgi:hypothetical protein